MLCAQLAVIPKGGNSVATHGGINIIKHLKSTTGENEEYLAGGQKEPKSPGPTD